MLQIPVRVSALMVAAAALWPVAAQAHPFGDPQTVDIAVDGATVELRWRAAQDDLTALAMRLNLIDGPRRTVFRDGALVPERSQAADVDLLAEHPSLSAYLLAATGVRVEGERCSGSVTDTTDLMGGGAVIVFECPRASAVVDVTMRTLTDIHPAYRTLAAGPGGATAVFDVDHPTHAFDSTSPDDPLARSGLTLAGLGAVGVACLIGSSLWKRRRRARA